MSTALYRKWRSQNFAEVVGQEHVTQTLRNALRDDRVAHAYLFSGPRGTGKTSTARILAKALNCSAPENERPCGQCPTCVAINENRMIDLIEIDAASNNSVDDVRELRDKVGFRPSEGRYKIYIIDEVHMLSLSAFNALLKTLEEPPPHTRFILATTEPHKIPATIISRCQRFDFRRIPTAEIAKHLRGITQAEGFQAEDDALTAIARAAQGGMRDAVSLLDQMFSYGSETVTFAQVQQVLGAVNTQAVIDFVNALASKNVQAGLMLIQQMVTQGASLVEFCHQIVEHLRGVMVAQLVGENSVASGLLNDLPGDTVRQMMLQAKQMAQPNTLYAIKRFSEAVIELKGGFQPQLPLEMALIEVIAGAPISAVANPPVVAATPVPVTQAPITQSPITNNPSPAGQPTTPPPAASVTSPADEPPPLDVAAVKKLRTQWKEFHNTVKGQVGQQAWAALNAVRDVAIGERSVAFAFGNNQFSHDIVAKPETLLKVTTILSNFVGRSVVLECQMGEQAHLTGGGRAISEKKSSDKDALLDYAVEALGAKIV